MANKNRTGYYPIGTLTGAPWNASVRRFVANNIVSNVCKGALMALAADGTAEVVTGASSNILGGCVGIEVVSKTQGNVAAASLTLERVYIPKNATAQGVYCHIVTDPFAIYETVTANGTTIGTSNIGEQYNVLSTAGGQQSPAKMPLDAGTLDVGNPQINAAGQLVLFDIGYGPGEDASNSTYSNVNSRCLVTISSSLLKAAKASNG